MKDISITIQIIYNGEVLYSKDTVLKNAFSENIVDDLILKEPDRSFMQKLFSKILFWKRYTYHSTG